MLTSLALIFLLGLIMGCILKKLQLPSLIGMIFTGIILGPYFFNLLDDSILLISSDLRKIALIIILTRAGLSLDINSLKKVGRPAILMCFIPAIFEMTAITLLAPILLDISFIEAAIIGAVVAAVSPAVIVPRMIDLIENGYGKEKSIPELIMAGASVDDIFVIVMFTSFTGLAQGSSVSASSFLSIPISIILGISLGILIGIFLIKLFKKVHIRDSIKVIIILSISFLLASLENVIKISGLISVISLSAIILNKNNNLAKRLSAKFSKLWLAAELLLFVLVGATVNISFAFSYGILPIILILVALLFRSLGVFLCLLRTKLNIKERLFCIISYIPKATVQAAIGSIPLSMGLSCGNIVLTIAVLSILITAPLGAILLDNFSKKLLTQDSK